MAIVASMQLHRVHGVGVARALSRMALDRFALRDTPGLRFAKLLGTGSGETFGVTDADLHRWGMFSVWESDDALAAYCAGATARRWLDFADESWSATLDPLRWRGTWANRSPFGAEATRHGLSRAPAVDAVPESDAVLNDDALEGKRTDEQRSSQMIAAVTRARIRPLQWRTFWSAVPPVAESMRTVDGLLYRVGIGEAPVGLQGTFSLWSNEGSLEAFAYRGVEHRDVIRRTHVSNWYSEELFARFALRECTGTLDGARY